jgi:hypothetical protein
MTYTYIASTNTLKQVPTMEKPGMPHGAVHLSTAYAWERASANYQEHLASLKEIACEPGCKEVWKDGDAVVEGKDFIVLGAGDWKWCTELKGNVFASPIKAESEDDVWKEAAHVLAERNHDGLGKQDSRYWIKWRGYYTALMRLKNQGYQLILRK